MAETILVIGSSGQIGTELVMELRARYGSSSVIASDLKPAAPEVMESGPFETLDALDKDAIHAIVKKYKVTQVYLLAALLSATAEKNPMFAWKLNMESLFHVLEMGREKLIQKIYWPSSIAVFGPTTPREHTPQFTVIEPSTVYGISKQAGERWCEWYFNKYGVDTRSLRYPGLIGWKSAPGGGTTDYAVHIFHEALKHNTYECFLSENTMLPMMYMPDAIRATISIMEAPSENIRIRGAYNLAGMSFSPKEIAAEVAKHSPGFTITYKPDFRQQMLMAGVRRVDGVLYTHDHADQTHGIDDLRVFAAHARRRIPAWMDEATRTALTRRFDYIFESQHGYPAIVEARSVPSHGEIWSVTGPGGDLPVVTFDQAHGPIRSVGYRFGPVAYSSDVSDIPEDSFAALQGVKVWIVDALRLRPHPTHAHLDLALQWAERVRPELTILTNLHQDMDYEALRAQLPPGVVPAYDQMELNLTL